MAAANKDAEVQEAADEVATAIWQEMEAAAVLAATVWESLEKEVLHRVETMGWEAQRDGHRGHVPPQVSKARLAFFTGRRARLEAVGRGKAVAEGVCEFQRGVGKGAGVNMRIV